MKAENLCTGIEKPEWESRIAIYCKWQLGADEEGEQTKNPRPKPLKLTVWGDILTV